MKRKMYKGRGRCIMTENMVNYMFVNTTGVAHYTDKNPEHATTQQSCRFIIAIMFKKNCVLRISSSKVDFMITLYYMTNAGKECC